MLDPSIILAGQQPDFVGQLQRGAQAAAGINAVGRENRLMDLYRTAGPQIMAGDQNALAQYAQVAGPEAAMGIQQTRQSMEVNAEQLKAIRLRAAQATKDAVKAENAEQLAARAEAAQRVVAMALADPQNADKYLASNEDTAQFVGMDPKVAGVAVMGAKDGLAEAFQMATGGNEARVQSSEILQDGTTVMVLSNGKTRVLSPDGQVLEGQGAAEAIDAARQARAEYERSVYGARREGTNVAEANTGTAAAAAGEAGKAAVDASSAAFEQAGKIGTSIGNIDDAIDALDRGGRAGAVDRFLPSVTEASASLRNAMDRMGLDVIGAVTFGALSEGELRLAMETAVPRNLNEPQLREWLAAKRAAQQKTMDMLLDAAVFLGTPGNTLPNWIERNRSSAPAGGSGSPTTRSGANQALDAIEADPETQRLLEKYGDTSSN